MVFGIVKQHQGWITCHSEVNQGTCFEIHLPRAPQAAPVIRAEPSVEPLGGSVAQASAGVHDQHAGLVLRRDLSRAAGSLI